MFVIFSDSKRLKLKKILITFSLKFNHGFLSFRLRFNHFCHSPWHMGKCLSLRTYDVNVWTFSDAVLQERLWIVSLEGYSSSFKSTLQFSSSSSNIWPYEVSAGSDTTSSRVLFVYPKTLSKLLYQLGVSSGHTPERFVRRSLSFLIFFKTVIFYLKIFNDNI